VQNKPYIENSVQQPPDYEFHAGNVPMPQPLEPKAAPIIITKDNIEVAFDEKSGDIVYTSMLNYKSETKPTFISETGSAYASFIMGSNLSYVRVNTENEDEIAFIAESDALRVEKKYMLKAGYNIPIDIIVTNLTGASLNIPIKAVVGTGIGEGFESESYVFSGAMIHNKQGTEKKKKDKVKESIYLSEPLWGGFTSKYFLFAVLGGSFQRAEIAKIGNSSAVQFDGSLTVEPEGTASIKNLSIFAGPKEYDSLRSYKIGLQDSIDYGLFFFLGIPMTKLMNFAYGFVHNYGIAIIILTMVVKLITLPLTLKSMISMRAMSKLQPEMAAIREKYKEEPQKINAATMELYRAHKINPLSGCLPIALQIPIFFALYKSLLVSIQLKGAPFFGWIQDLSMHDPYYITPILMGGTMFLQQKMTPTTADPTQQKIFLIMPVVFTFLFLKFQSGLVVYWLTNNVLSIAQQYIINKKMK
jgi:YidC/Oxa1 family membrane protein insertase